MGPRELETRLKRTLVKWLDRATLHYVDKNYVEQQDRVGSHGIQYRDVEPLAAVYTQQRGQDPTRQLGRLAFARFKHRARGLFQRDSTRQATSGRVSPVPDLEYKVRERHVFADYWPCGMGRALKPACQPLT